MKIPLVLGASCALLVCACSAEGWRPRPPSGLTYQYDYQGFQENRVQVMAGTSSGPGGAIAMGGGFNTGRDSELHGAQQADPFVESAPIDGIRFNEHLADQGVALLPVSSAVPATSSPPASSSASSRSAPPQPGGQL